MSGPVVVLAGGTGGAMLARGMLDVVGEDLVVVANTVGDRDLALCLARARRLAAGARLTDCADAVRRAYGVPAAVLPVTDDPVRTRVRAGGAWHDFQEYMIRAGAPAPVEDVEFTGAGEAAPTPEVLAALEDARAVVIGPSNPVLSIGPMLAVPGVRQALRETRAPVVAVSPLVAGRVLKGPTAPFMAWARHPLDSDGIAAVYDGLLDGLVADQRTDSLPTLETDVAMPDSAARSRLAREALQFAR